MHRHILMTLLLGLLSMAARNQESRIMSGAINGSGTVRAVFVDNQGVKWFGTSEGLWRFDNLDWTYYSDSLHLSGNQVNALTFAVMDGEPVLWVATGTGVSRLVLDGNGIASALIFTTAEGLLDDDVRDIAIDSRERVFFGSAGGVTWMHGDTLGVVTYPDYQASMVDNPVRKMGIYGDTLYLAQDGGIGRLVSGVDGISGATRWTSEYGMTPYSGNIRSILVNGAEKQYFGTDAGLETHSGYEAKENWGSYAEADGLVNNDVISIAEDGEGGLWMGTFGGVSCLKDGSWSSYTTMDGLPNDTVLDIAFDTDGGIWFGTASGPCKLKDGVFSSPLSSFAGPEIPLEVNRALEDPYSGSIRIIFWSSSNQPARIRLFTLDGKMAAEWQYLRMTVGENRLDLPGSGFRVAAPRGIYILVLTQGESAWSEKLILSPGQ